ncbi:MAG: DUF2500 domain-containing protein [Clostridia bacterium]|nr:DUF2500 domain-containing protein [Clostridia bacterium]
MSFSSFNNGVSAMFLIFLILFLITFCTIIVKLITEAVANKKAPQLTVNAKLVDKEQKTYHEHNATTNMTTYHTNYFLTFEAESGDIIRLKCNKDDYNLHQTFESGKLTFKGKIFIDFQGEY